VSRSSASGASTAERDPAPASGSNGAPEETGRLPAYAERLSPHGASVAALVLGAALAGVVFGAAGGTQLTRTTIVEVLMVLVGGAVVAAGVLWSRAGRLWGGATLLLFAGLAVLTALSILWAIVPELAFVETGRTLAYLAVFAASVAVALLAPGATPVVIKGILIASVAAIAYALAARVWPGALAENELSNRIGQPFQYWNAVGTTAALAIPGLLWLGARRAGGPVTRSLAHPAIGAAILAILLTQSRGALVAAVLGAIAWFAIVPLRLRSLPVLLLPGAVAGAVAAWALSKDAFAVSAQPLAVKESVAGEFGLLLVLMALCLLLAGLAVNIALARYRAPMELRRRVGIAAVAVVCAVPLVALGSVALSDRGLTGTIEDRVDELTSETDTAPVQGAGRLTAASSTRGKYWREAGRVFEDRPWAGTGAGTFATARLRHRTDAGVTRHAHGYVAQTLADLGVIGVALTTALLLAWLVAAARATALNPRRLPFRREDDPPLARRDWDGERIALLVLTLMAVVFGLQSLIDWTWFIPGPTAMALVAAGFVAGRGPLAAAGDAQAVERSAEVSGPARPPTSRIVGAVAVMLAALLVAWAIWQPEASDRATGEALDLLVAEETDAALAKTEDAADANPLSPDPLLVRAAVLTESGREGAAREALEQAVLKFPGDPHTWQRLATFQLRTLDRPAAAAQTIRGALYLDPFSPSSRQLYVDARVREGEQQAAE